MNERKEELIRRQNESARREFKHWCNKAMRLFYWLSIGFLALAILAFFTTWFFAKHGHGGVYDSRNWQTGIKLFGPSILISGGCSVISFILKPKWWDIGVLSWNILFAWYAFITLVGFSD